jgi:RNA polymerase sigma-70 factor (ECF subfamily)
VPEATVAQRIVRAKRLIRERHLPYTVPGRSELPERLASVLSVIYLIFNEGYSSHGGPSLTRVDLCHEAIRLGTVLVELMAGAFRSARSTRFDGGAGLAQSGPRGAEW